MSNCKAFFYEHQFVKNQDVPRIMSRNPSLQGIVTFGESAEVPKEVHVWSEIFQAKSKRATEPDDLPSPCNLDEEFVILCSSGSTGKPKAVVHTNRAFAFCGLHTERLLGTTADTRFLMDRPLTYAGGFLFLWVYLNYLGKTVVVLDARLSVGQADLPDIFDIIQKESINTLLIFGYMLHDMLEVKDFPSDKLTSLKVGITGGQVLNTDQMAKLCHLLPNLTLYNIYGASEVIVAAVSHYDTQEGYVRAVEGVEMKLVDPTGKVVPRGESGEVCVRSPGTSKGYMTKAGLQSLLDKEGWYHTADLAVMNEKRDIKILGRASDVIKRATVFVYPQVIETVLRKHLKVAGAHVIGVPDPRLYEDLCAVVVPSDPSLTEEELNTWSKAQFPVDATGMSLAPTYYRFISSIEDVPRLPGGKVNKLALKELVFKNW